MIVKNLVKFKHLWNVGIKAASLSIEAVDGQVSVTFKADLDHVIEDEDEKYTETCKSFTKHSYMSIRRPPWAFPVPLWTGPLRRRPPWATPTP